MHFADIDEAVDLLLELAFKSAGLCEQSRNFSNVNQEDLRDAHSAVNYLAREMETCQTISRRLLTAFITISHLFPDRDVPGMKELRNQLELFVENWVLYTECTNEFSNFNDQ